MPSCHCNKKKDIHWGGTVCAYSPKYTSNKRDLAISFPMISLLPWPRVLTNLRSCPTRRSSDLVRVHQCPRGRRPPGSRGPADGGHGPAHTPVRAAPVERDRKSTRLNSSHVAISYAVLSL